MRPGGKVGGRREDGGRARGGRSESGGRAPGGRGAGGERTVVRRREGPVVLRVVGRGGLLFVQKLLASILFPVLLMNVLPTLLTPGKPEGCGPQGLRYSGRDGPGEHWSLRPFAAFIEIARKNMQHSVLVARGEVIRDLSVTISV